MAISDQTIQDYIEAIKNEYGADITWEEAVEQLNTLVGYFDVLHQIDTRDKLEEHGRRN